MLICPQIWGQSEELCEKRHDHVLRDIEKMLQDIGHPKFGASSFEAEYTTANGG